MSVLLAIFQAILSLAAPTGAMAVAFLKFIGQFKNADIEAALGILGSDQAKRLFDWAKAALAVSAPDGVTIPAALLPPNYSDDFMEVMGGTKYTGAKLTMEDCQTACNQMAKFDKEGNVIAGIMYAVQFFSMVGGGAL